jgi:D-tyrosyl-tRNA(Tyr) deacylase
VKVLVQRVSRAEVRVEGRVAGAVGKGLLVFLGVERDDTRADVDHFAAKVAELRVFADETGRMNLDVAQAGGALLVVSQFTLAASTRRGRRPSFDRAAPPETARALYEEFTARLAARGLVVATGVFQAMMEVELVNDGPVTILLEPRTGVTE